MKPEDVVVISGAAGATGSIAVQLAAKVIGCKRVIGIAGGQKKVRFSRVSLSPSPFWFVSFRARGLTPRPDSATGSSLSVLTSASTTALPPSLRTSLRLPRATSTFTVCLSSVLLSKGR